MSTSPKPDLKWRVNFLRGILKGNSSLTGPFCAAIDVTERCNLQCAGCPWHSPSSKYSADVADRRLRDFDWNDFEKLCRSLRKLGTAKMILIGQGEPLLHPRLIDMVKMAKDTGFYLTLFTNATLLDYERAAALSSSGLDEIKVSLWAANSEEYSCSYPQADPLFFERAVNGGMLMHQVREELQSRLPKIILHRPIERDLFQGLENMIDLALDMGCDALTFSPLKPMGGVEKGRDLRPHEEKELGAILGGIQRQAESCGVETNIPDVLQRYRIGEEVWQRAPCYVGWIDVRIRVSGDVLPCGSCQKVMGNIHQSTIEEIWNSPAFLGFRGAVRTCEGLRRMASCCDCRFCCHVLTNLGVHRIFKWIPAFNGILVP